MNAIVFYSSTIFKNANVPPNKGTAVTQTVSMLCVFGCTLMLKYAGRKTLMTVWFFGLAILSVLMSIFALKGLSNAELAVTIGFVSVF